MSVILTAYMWGCSDFVSTVISRMGLINVTDKYVYHHI
jgi:hypothetical protein